MRFQPLKLLERWRKPYAYQWSDEVLKDRLLRLAATDEYAALQRLVAETIDQMVEYASSPSLAGKPEEVIHTQGGIYALRGLIRKLDAVVEKALTSKPRE